MQHGGHLVVVMQRSGHVVVTSVPDNNKSIRIFSYVKSTACENDSAWIQNTDRIGKRFSTDPEHRPHGILFTGANLGQLTRVHTVNTAVLVTTHCTVCTDIN